MGAVKNEFRELFRLAVPLAASAAGSQLMGLVDVAVLGRYGARELAAASIGNAVYFALSVIGQGIVLGIDPLISQAIGARDPLRARRALWHGVWLCLIVTAALTVVLLVGALALPVICTPSLVPLVRIYLLIRIAGLLPFLLFFAARAYLQALGKTRALVVAMVIANVMNFCGDMILVFGAGPIPSLGVVGAAIATLVSGIVQLIIVAFAIESVDVDGTIDRGWSRNDVVQAFHVGFPVGLHMGAEVGVFALIALIASHLGTTQLAAHQVVLVIASFTFTVAVGVASAGSVRVGIAVGARDAERTRRSGYVTFAGTLLVMGTSALIFALFPTQLARVMTNDHTIVVAAIPLMFIAAVFQLSDGVQAAGAGVLRGAGDTRFVFYANVLGHWLVGLPIALFLGFTMRMGIVGLWWGLSAGLTVVAVLLFVRFERLSRDVIVPIGESRKDRSSA